MTSSTRFSQYLVVRAREPASFWREDVVVVVILLRVLARIGTLRSADAYGDGNENFNKAIGLISKTTIFARASRFFVHFFAVTARLRRENA